MAGVVNGGFSHVSGLTNDGAKGTNFPSEPVFTGGTRMFLNYYGKEKRS